MSVSQASTSETDATRVAKNTLVRVQVPRRYTPLTNWGYLSISNHYRDAVHRPGHSRALELHKLTLATQPQACATQLSPRLAAKWRISGCRVDVYSFLCPPFPTIYNYSRPTTVCLITFAAETVKETEGGGRDREEGHVKTYAIKLVHSPQLRSRIRAVKASSVRA